MSELNRYIDTSRQFTAQPEGVPVPDRTEQVNFGLEIARRASQEKPAAPPAPMPPIVPVSN